MKQDELNKILGDHLLWLRDDTQGKRADLSWADLPGANLSRANLSEADLSWANLSEADLSEADLREANLSGTNFYRTNLLIFQHNKHMACYQGTHIKIGCEYHMIAYWLNNYKTVGKKHHYTKEEIESYGNFIKLCAKQFKIKKENIHETRKIK